MKAVYNELYRVFELTLSRRNLLTMLAKLDGHPPRSLCTIARSGDGLNEPKFILYAEEDELHYGERGYGPGEMHPDTEGML